MEKLTEGKILELFQILHLDSPEARMHFIHMAQLAHVSDELKPKSSDLSRTSTTTEEEENVNA